MSNDSLKVAFQDEATELLRELEESLLALEADTDNRELVDRAFRAMHTIKGTGAMAGCADLAAFTHEVESVFDLVRQNMLSATPELISLTLGCVDFIRRLVASNELTDLDRMTQGSLFERLDALRGTVQQAPKPGAAAHNHYIVDFVPGPLLFDLGLNPMHIFDELSVLGTCRINADVRTIPRLDQLDYRRLSLSWRVELHTPLSRQQLDEVFLLIPEDTVVQITEVREEEDRVEESSSTTDTRVIEESVRVSTAKLDALVAMVGELVIAQSRLQQHVGQTTDESLKDIVEHLDRLTTDLRDGALGIRMRPVGQVFSRFQRVVRDLGQTLGKPVRFLTEGDEVEIDKGVLDHIVDPIIHLIRNAVDHGIESADERRAAGKPEVGNITLRARQQYGSVVIEVEDDGGGIDPARVLASAKTKGLVDAHVSLSDSEAVLLILQPGFSTADEVSDVSGRGVGLDVVRRVVEALQGNLSIDSKRAEGTKFIFTLPLTLSIIEGLLVRVASETYVLPLAQVDRVLEVPPGDPTFRAWRGMIRHGASNVPYIRLRHWFETYGQPSEFEKLVVTQADNQPLAYIVDEVVGHSQIVVKDLLGVMQRKSGVSGATILGDGRVALILDASKLLELILGGPEMNDSANEPISSSIVASRAQSLALPAEKLGHDGSSAGQQR